MMWHSHVAMGADATWMLVPLLPKDAPAVIVIAMFFSVIGTLVPDLDAVESKIKHGQVMGINPPVLISKALNRELGHRGLLHSIWGWLGWAILILPLGIITGGLLVAALSLGYASHLAGDACTRTGIPLLYPKQKRWFLMLTRLRVTTGSAREELFTRII